MNINVICIYFVVLFMMLGLFYFRMRVVIIMDGKFIDFGMENSDDIYEFMGLDKVRVNVL